MKNTFYYLFGSTACRIYDPESIWAVKYCLINLEGAIFKFTLGDHPNSLLLAFSGWNDFIEITETEFNKLKL